MTDKTLRLVARQKADALHARFRQMERTARTKPQVPKKLEWVVSSFDGYHRGKMPPGCCRLSAIMADETPIDRVARTFAALQDFEAWLDRVEDGERRHQEEILRQCQAKLVRLQTEAVMNGR